MLIRSRREARLWALVAGYTLLIYTTLGAVRPLTEALRERNLLRAAIAVAFAGAALAVLAWLWRRRPQWREWAVLGAAGGGYAAVLPFAIRPEEQIHLIEYGALGALLYAALLERRRATLAANPDPEPLPGTVRRPAWAALLMATALGWIDEGIQDILPQRFYDLRDAAFNTFAAGLAIAAMAGLAWARRQAPSGAARGVVEEEEASQTGVKP